MMVSVFGVVIYVPRATQCRFLYKCVFLLFFSTYRSGIAGSLGCFVYQEFPFEFLINSVEGVQLFNIHASICSLTFY